MVKPRKPPKPRKRKSYVDVLFGDSISGAMLRTLHTRGSMPQADFMTLYHVRCARSNPGRSSFANNFFRYVLQETRWPDVTQPRAFDHAIGCITRRHERSRVTLTWARPVLPEILATLDDKAIDKVENTLERITIRDNDPETLRYLDDVRHEMHCRAKRLPATVKVDFGVVAAWLRANDSRFGDWYDNGAELDDSVPAMTGDVLKHWEHIRAVAESWDFTVIELLDSDGIRWGKA